MLIPAVGRVERQKLNQVAALLLPRLGFGVQLDYSCRKKLTARSGQCRSSAKVLSKTREIKEEEGETKENKLSSCSF